MGYAYLVSEILGCLVAAAALGGGIVWWWMNQKQTDWNAELLTARQKFETASLELAAAKKGLSEESKRTAELTSSLSAVAAKHKELEAVAAGKERSLTDWGAKHAALESDLKARTANWVAAQADIDALRHRMASVDANARAKDEALQMRDLEFGKLRGELAVRLANVKGLEVRLGELSSYPAKLSEQEANVAQLTKEMDAAVARLSAEISGQTTRIRSLEEQLREADKERDALSVKSKDRTGEVARLRGQLADAERQAAGLAAASAAEKLALQASIAASKADLAALKTQIGGLQERLKDDQIRSQIILQARENLVS